MKNRDFYTPQKVQKCKYCEAKMNPFYLWDRIMRMRLRKGYMCSKCSGYVLDMPLIGEQHWGRMELEDKTEAELKEYLIRQQTKGEQG